MRPPYRILVLWTLSSALTVMAQSGAIVSGFNTTQDVRNDDGTWTAPAGCTAADEGGTCAGTKVDLGFTVNFFGLQFSQVYINTNGNVTFDAPLPSYTPFNLTSTNRQIIAPFFADVDTRHPASGTTTFGQGTFGGRAAFGVTWLNVGYYNQRADKRNSFQLILVERSDTGAGNFDIIFNYNSIQWETGEAPSSGGVDGLGGRSARAGYSNGTGISGTALELRGSATPGSFLDSNLATGLRYDSLNSDVPGRYVFFARAGQIISGGLGIAGTCPLPAGFQGVAYPPFAVNVSGGTPPYTFTSTLPPGLTFDATTLTVSGTPTASGLFPISIAVTDSAPGVLQQTREYTCTISIAAAPPPLAITGPCTSGLQNRPYWMQLAIRGGSGNYTVEYQGPSWLAPAPSAPVPQVYTYSLAGTPPSSGTFPVTVRARDSAGASSTFHCVITIAPSITITSACPASPVRADTTFMYQFQSLGGQSTPLWNVVRGRLPAGLTMSNTGLVFGTPEGPPGSSWTFTVGVTSGTVSDEKTCTMGVLAPQLRLVSQCPVNGAVGVPYTFNLAAVGGLGRGTYRFSTAGSLPAGLSISNESIIGRPELEGSYTFRVQVTSGDQTVASAPCTVTIGPSPIDVLGTCPALTQRVGVPLTAAFTAVGGRPPYVYSLTGPSWLTQADGVVAGVPPASAEGSSVTFRLAAFDTAGVMNSRTCTFNVGAAPANPTVTGTCPAGARAPGSEIAVPLWVAGGHPPYSWVYDGGLAELALESDAGERNALKGKVEKTGEFAATVHVVDSAGVQADPLTCKVTVAEPTKAAVRLAAGEVPADLLAPVAVEAVLEEPAAAEIRGTVRVRFDPAAAYPVENPEVTLSQGYEVAFRIPAGSRRAPLGHVQRGTVAGLVRLEWVALEGPGSAGPGLEIAAPGLAPVFSGTVEETAGGIEVVLRGYSTLREITGGRVVVRGRDGSVRVVEAAELPQRMADYYSKTRTGAFDNLRIAVPVEGGLAGVESMTVELRNSAGAAEAAVR